MCKQIQIYVLSQQACKGLRCGNNLFALGLKVLHTKGSILLISVVPPISFIEAHKQLNHIGFGNLEHMWTSNNSGGLSIAPRGDSFCDSYLEANMKCSLFHSHESCLATKLDRIHTNLAGPLLTSIEKHQ